MKGSTNNEGIFIKIKETTHRWQQPAMCVLNKIAPATEMDQKKKNLIYLVAVPTLVIQRAR